MDTASYIEQAVEQFRALITEQNAREDRMRLNRETADYSKKDKIVIGVVGGDGIGPVITQETVEALKVLLADEIGKGKIELKEIDGLTIENRIRLGEAVPQAVLDEIKTCDVFLKGPTETPKGGTMASANVTLRRELDLFANVRPVCVPELGIDWTFFRENTEGEYVLGNRGVEIPGKLAMDFKVTTLSGTRRIARAAFEFAKQNGKKRLAIVTKANIMKKTDGMFSEICHEIAQEYPEIEVEDRYIDIMTAELVNESKRGYFQVFLLPNLYGDIITDEAAQIQGGVGTAGSANIGDKYAMFEAIHGTAPRMIAEGYSEYANPSSVMRAAAMMLRHIGYTKKAQLFDEALDDCTRAGIIVSRHNGGAKGTALTEHVIAYIKDNL